MKRFLLCLALCLVPVSLNAQECAKGVCLAPEVKAVDVDQEVAYILSLFEAALQSNLQVTNELGAKAQQLVMEVQFSVEDEKTVAAVGQTFQQGFLLYQLAMENVQDGAKSAMLATLESGPVAASLRLSAASKYSTAIACLLRCRGRLEAAIKLAEEALGNVESEGPSAGIRTIPKPA